MYYVIKQQDKATISTTPENGCEMFEDYIDALVRVTEINTGKTMKQFTAEKEAWYNGGYGIWQ